VDFETIYRRHADTYDALVAREDFQGNLTAALHEILPSSSARVLDIGTGTGRVARLLCTEGAQVVACDRALPMLRTAAATVECDVSWSAADNRRLPFRSGLADLVIAGWSLGHSVEWYGDSWPVEIGRALAEMERVAGRDGVLAVIETLGTGREAPLAPTQGLADYYRWLEEEHGFARHWLRTDYLFESNAEAEQLIRFFFGDEMGDQVKASGTRLVPECTGLWTRSLVGGT
jgi:ubiquinone/menaquinone biosynthesis C-methylase UbiE